jgi:hypothetical protein
MKLMPAFHGMPKSLQNHQRAHHVVFFVFKNVAVPNVFIPANPWAGGHGEGN